MSPSSVFTISPETTPSEAYNEGFRRLCSAMELLAVANSDNCDMASDRELRVLTFAAEYLLQDVDRLMTYAGNADQHPVGLGMKQQAVVLV